MNRSNYMCDFYKQFEELNKKLDKANNTITHMSLTISNQADEIKNLTQELAKSIKKNEELKLINRLIKYVNNHLLFLKKFFVPFSNNQAESNLRGVKIKQKTGKFRSLEGANIYAIIKSCISTYNKNNINLYEAFT